jgi:D-alanyl-D-alanine carboxypeptidase
VAIVKRGGKRIIVAFFNSWDSLNDAKKLIEFGFRKNK